MAPPTSVIPPPLPPSVEEAYRRKCVQLKRRMNEVEESNDAAYLRVTRLRREIEKLRLERSFLLEQLSKRTPTNVDDSEGSPSPPPTPKEKPLRTKRGHRKPDFMQNINPASGYSHQGTAGFLTLSPTSETFSQNQNQDSATGRASSPPTAASRNGHPAAASKSQSKDDAGKARPRNAFDLYCNEVRPSILADKAAEIEAGTLDVDLQLAEGWQALGQADKDAVQRRFETYKANEKENGVEQSGEKELLNKNGEGVEASKADEDVEMADDAGGSEAGGFTSVNQG